MTEGQAKTEVNLDGAPTIATPPIEASPEAADSRIGMLLKDSYRIERRLGSGGMGSVYLAEHEAIRKKVAVKILDIEPAQRPDLKERFLREARAAAAIPDDHVIAIHDFGDTPDGSVFFVMEYLQGVDLSNMLSREAPLPWPRARDITLQICRALQAAHERGIVHRDMKPANIFRVDRTDRDFIKVLDFGIAKILNPDAGLGVALTRTGMLFGTPEYMSPEQAQGERLDHRVDIYAVGVILFEMLTGQLPFRAETFMALLNRHMFDAPPRPAEVAPQADIPPAAEAVVLKAMQKNPALRFQTMAEMADALIAVDAGIAPIVVPESLRSPASGSAMSFATREARAGDRRRLYTILGAVVGVAATAAIITLSSGTDPEPLPPPAPVAAPPQPVAPPPEPVPEPVRDEKPPPPQATVITVHIDTGKVAAYIYDEDNALRGNTANPDGVSLIRGETDRTLVLRAPGYEELRIKVLPVRDTNLTATMTRRRPVEPKPEVKPETPEATPVTDPAADPDTKLEPDTKLPADTKTPAKPDTKTPAKPDTKTSEPPPLTPDTRPGPLAPKPKKPGPP